MTQDQDMAKNDNVSKSLEEENYPTPDDYRKEDLMKAGKIMIYSVISAGIVTALLYYFPI